MAGTGFPISRIVVLAAVAGMIAGGLAVYVRGGLEGNAAPDTVTASATPDDAASRACAAKADKARAVAGAATGEVAAMLPADPPQSLATLGFNDPSGKPVTLADFAGRTVLLNLWATWCAPCREEMPALDELQRQAGAGDFEVVAVNVDTGDDEKPKRFLSETNIQSLAYYRDSSLALFNELKKRSLALGLPVTLLVDAEGCLLANMNGPAEWASPDALRLVDLAKAP